jgi:outer membrane receptor for Fe3+-dicitrate
LISETIVKKLGLITKPHKKPYPLGWIHNDNQLQVDRQCVLKFAINSQFIDEVELDVVPLDICGIVLGSPYLYDRKEIFYREDNKYQLTKDGKEYIVRAHQKKLNLSLINSGKMKRIVNVSKRYLLYESSERARFDVYSRDPSTKQINGHRDLGVTKLPDI